MLNAVKEAELAEATNKEKDDKNVSDSNSMKIAGLENRMRRATITDSKNPATLHL